VKINIPEVLIHLRGEVVRYKQGTGAGLVPDPENLAMKMLAGVFASQSRFERMQKLGRFGQRFMMRDGVISRLPGYLGGWTAVRDVYPIAQQTFREWWREREKERSNAGKPS
jgi:L-lactate dehydrogenase complex protein LldF